MASLFTTEMLYFPAMFRTRILLTCLLKSYLSACCSPVVQEILSYPSSTAMRRIRLRTSSCQVFLKGALGTPEFLNSLSQSFADAKAASFVVKKLPDGAPSRFVH